MEKEDFLRLVNNTSDFSKKFVSKSYSLMKRIRKQMEEKAWEQKDLAKALDKSEPEISKWLSGFHNFTFKSLMKLEEALECDLILVPTADEHLSFSGGLPPKKLPVMVETQPSQEKLDFIFESKTDLQYA